MVLKLFTTFIVVAAILASPKHRDFTWSYHSSIYRVHWGAHVLMVNFFLFLSFNISETKHVIKNLMKETTVTLRVLVN